MRKTFLGLIFLICFLATFVYADSRDSFSIGEIVFDCYYVNFAWGYRLEGFYVDHNGNIYKYNRNGNPWLPERVKRGSPQHPEIDLLDKFQNKKLIGNIEMKTMEQKINLISDAASGTITRRHRSNDMGGRSCAAYYFDNDKKIFKEINLGSTGDIDEENSSERAKELLLWLKQFWTLTR